MPRQAKSGGPRPYTRGRRKSYPKRPPGPNHLPSDHPGAGASSENDQTQAQHATETATRVAALMKEGLTVEEAVSKALLMPAETATPAAPPQPNAQGSNGGENSAPSTQPDGTPATPAAPAPINARPTQIVEGLLQISDKGYGFLRDPKNIYIPQRTDVFVLPEIIRVNNLREGVMLKGEMVQSNRGPQLRNLSEVNGEAPEKYRDLMPFEQLTTINPNKRFVLETNPEILTTRVIDLVAPIGKGQRGLIVAPPRTGKTTLLQHIANAITINHPEVYLMVLLVDERPEEATEVKRNVKGDVIYSTNDMNIQSHTHISLMAIEKAKRLAESGKDVFLLLDSLTRLGRAFNNNMGNSGRTLSGGMDARGMEIPRKIFAAARNTEESGSLTIVASALIDTGSRMDELIFQEFKGTGNMELVLDRKLADARIFPAVDINKSGTRREELLVPTHELEKMNKVRRGLAGQQPDQAMERLLTFLQKYPTNSEFLRQIP